MFFEENMKSIFICIFLLMFTTASFAFFNTELISGNPQIIPVPNTVTMVDIGAKKCIPCKMMAPILEELAIEYEGRAAIAFIDVWQNPDEAQKFGIRTIPTQMFYDKDGNEVLRHEGFYGKAEIENVLKDLGVQ